MSNNNWPVGPIIRVRRATAFGGRHIRDAYAIRDAGGDYLVDGATLLRDAGDSIDAWEEVTAVPTAALKRLQDAFRGIDVIESLEPPLLEVLSCLTADKPSPLDRAVTRVKDIEGGRMIDAESTQEERLSLLLDSLASVQSATRKTAPLTMVARICVDWADLENPRRDSLEAARERTKVLSDPGSFIVLSALVGDVTTALCDNFSPRHDLIDAGAYALAWAAQTIEEEEDK
jgi:hypothetical protein